MSGLVQPGPFLISTHRGMFCSGGRAERGPGGGEVKKGKCVYFWLLTERLRDLCATLCALCVACVLKYIYIRRRIDFSPRVDASGGADGLRTTAPSS